MLWASCHAKTFNSEGAVDDKKVGAGEKTGKIYGKLATFYFFLKNSSIMLHCSSLLSSPPVQVVEEKQGEGKGQEPSARTRPDLSINLSIYLTFSSSVSSYLIHSFSISFYLVLSICRLSSPRLQIHLEYPLWPLHRPRSQNLNPESDVCNLPVARDEKNILRITTHEKKSEGIQSKQKNIKMYHICTISIYITYRTVRFDVDLLEQV